MKKTLLTEQSRGEKVDDENIKIFTFSDGPRYALFYFGGNYP